MIYLSKGTVQAGATERLLFVLYCGQRFELTGETASTWLDGRFDFAEAANRREASVAYLANLGLVETEPANDALSRYRIATRCIFCPADTERRPMLGRTERRILQWLEGSGIRLTVAELVYLMEHGIEPATDLLYTENRQRLIERIYELCGDEAVRCT